uniref:Uncharacterized protein n=1 Tax=Romanomermis culicivorax TaxID=13658 RepID=A0A915L8F3_ROMCU
MIENFYDQAPSGVQKELEKKINSFTTITELAAFSELIQPELRGLNLIAVDKAAKSKPIEHVTSASDQQQYQPNPFSRTQGRGSFNQNRSTYSNNSWPQQAPLESQNQSPMDPTTTILSYMSKLEEKFDQLKNDLRPLSPAISQPPMERNGSSHQATSSTARVIKQHHQVIKQHHHTAIIKQITMKQFYSIRPQWMICLDHQLILAQRGSSGPSLEQKPAVPEIISVGYYQWLTKQETKFFEKYHQT